MDEEESSIHLEGVPDDYVDPELMDVRLPQPFRMIDALVQEAFDNAWDMITVAGLDKRSSKDGRQGDVRSACPSHIIEEVVTTEGDFPPSLSLTACTAEKAISVVSNGTVMVCHTGAGSLVRSFTSGVSKPGACLIASPIPGYADVLLVGGENKTCVYFSPSADDVEESEHLVAELHHDGMTANSIQAGVFPTPTDDKGVYTRQFFEVAVAMKGGKVAVYHIQPDIVDVSVEEREKGESAKQVFASHLVGQETSLRLLWTLLLDSRVLVWAVEGNATYYRCRIPPPKSAPTSSKVEDVQRESQAWSVSSPITSLTSNPAGTFLYLGLSSGSVIGYDAAVGTVVIRLSCIGSAVTALSVLPNGRWIAVGTARGVFELFDVMSGERRFSVDPMEDIRNLVKSGLWSAQTDVSSFPVRAISCSADLPVALCTSTDGVVRVFDVRDGAFLGTLADSIGGTANPASSVLGGRDPFVFACVGPREAPVEGERGTTGGGSSRAGTPRDKLKKQASKKGKPGTPQTGDAEGEGQARWPIRVQVYRAGDVLFALLPSLKDAVADPFAGDMAKNFFLSLHHDEEGDLRSKSNTSKPASRMSRTSGAASRTPPMAASRAGTSASKTFSVSTRAQRRVPSRGGGTEGRSRMSATTKKSRQGDSESLTSKVVQWDSEDKSGGDSYQMRLGVYLADKLTGSAERKAKLDERRKDGSLLNTNKAT
eukprot:CAMPEP_0113918644 /NCGR_PEP_ID=MMETSP0780_2-20120614/33477_1 /TAXON_ID=652834 /ORGANISM="Palpitomonas bilix" /LENGTH=709 /DNA_ID=CAMNT_0000918497 /DNA_START=177 /DNA_END=2306 /DNA_ORIENTATION=- /assembly_acc=CAM_ASM_000599